MNETTNQSAIMNIPTAVTSEHIKMGMEVLFEMGKVIRGLKVVPSGTLYAQVSNYMSLETYQKAIETLKETGLIREENHQLIWIG